MLVDQLRPGQAQYFIENRLGQPGQVVTDLHQRQAVGDFRCGDAQQVRLLEGTQRFHLHFQVVFRNAQHLLA